MHRVLDHRLWDFAVVPGAGLHPTIETCYTFRNKPWRIRPDHFLARTIRHQPPRWLCFTCKNPIEMHENANDGVLPAIWKISLALWVGELLVRSSSTKIVMFR